MPSKRGKNKAIDENSKPANDTSQAPPNTKGKGGRGQEKKNKTKKETGKKKTGSKRAMKKASKMPSGVKKPYKHRPGFLSKTTLQTDLKITKIPFKTGHVYSKEGLMSAVKKL